MGRRNDNRGGRFSGARRRGQDFFSLENIGQLTLVAVGALVIWSLAGTRILPQIAWGPDCANLPNPPGGNQRSLLAATDDSQDLRLEIRIANSVGETNPAVPVGQPLELQVIFHNRDIGPIYLYYDETTVVPIGTNFNNVGLFLEFTAANNNTFQFTDGSFSGVPQPTTFDLIDIGVLEAKNDCNVKILIEGERLQRMNLGVGDYRVKAHYVVNAPGQPPVVANPTATPMFFDQGVWVGNVESPELRFSILQQ